MASSENKPSSHSSPPAHACLHKFRLYETLSNFYMIGRDKSRTYWRVLKIDRLDPSELNVLEDSTTYTESECSDLLKRIHEGNRSTGGLKFVTTCYGIVGFIKFLGPYYMLLITKRRQIGAISGNTVYAVSKCEMIPLQSSSVHSNITDSINENRYKKLLCMVDLTKDFFFSYSYHIMRSLQKNLCDSETGHVLYETMFVWNEFLTRGIRNHLQNTVWTVALVYGFFKQETLTISGREFILTLIARRSRHYAGTRYLRRGVNDKGRVANDVETEQIVFEDVPEGLPVQICSSHERKPRESILRSEFGKAIDFINKDLSQENRLRFLHWDLKHFQSFAYGNIDKGSFQPTRQADVDNKDGNTLERKPSGESNLANGNHFVKPPMFQRGVLRTNCIDCLDRTNVAQYAYGLAALGHQLHALGIIDHPKIDLDDPLSDDLMGFYERMGDTLAHQYGGSAAHKKIFSERRGQWKAATQSQEFFRTLQRYYSNAYMDAEKQNAINIFLGHFQPQLGKPALWDLGSDQHYDIGRYGDDDARCFSDGSIIDGNSTPMSTPNPKLEKFSKLGLQDQSEEGSKAFCESSPEISTSSETESDMSFSRYTPLMPHRHLFGDIQRERFFHSDHISYSGHGDSFSSSNFVDLDWLSSGNSCEEEPFERPLYTECRLSITNSSIARLSSENVINGVIMGGDTPSTSDLVSNNKGRERTGSELSNRDGRSKVLEEFPDTFVNWVTNGQTLCN
ncbi:hypothetical protein JHK85_024874 [Glycine max]|nr:hypothetical protein JHK85_024874 [Glycine max]